jgi:hypothetical protein
LTSAAGCRDDPHVPEPIEYRWRGQVTDTEMMALVTARGGQAVAGWWDQVRPFSLGWVTARLQDGRDLVGFVNVTWDGGDHAFLLDIKVASEHQRQASPPSLSPTPFATPRRQAVNVFTWTSESTSRRFTSLPAVSGPRLPG